MFSFKKTFIPYLPPKVCRKWQLLYLRGTSLYKNRSSIYILCVFHRRKLVWNDI